MFWLILLLCLGCVEPYDLQTDVFEDFLVVEALLTDQVEFQEIKLSRTFPLEDGTLETERNANVSIIDDMNMEYTFNEVEFGTYVSEIAFGAVPDRQYELNITTNSGRKYTSIQEQLVEGDVVDFNLYTQAKTTNDGVEGVAIYYENSEQGNEASRYFRFEYVETYKIVPPYWSTDYFVINQNGNVNTDIKENEDGKVCFGSAESNEIILRNASEFALNNIEPFVIKFTDQLDKKIQNRYSLLVKQHLISREAYTFFETLKDFSDSGSVLSETQPGTILGNLYAVDNPRETVIGFFEVAKTLEKRVFFNYTDYFYDSQLFLRSYYYPCDVMLPFRNANPNVSQDLSLAQMVEAGMVIFYAENYGGGISLDPHQPYYVVVPECGDCSVFGDMTEPDFWEE